MPYFADLNTYLHQSSLLLQAYPSTTRITTKYSLPRKPSEKSKSKPKSKLDSETVASSEPNSTAAKRDPSSILTLKTFEANSGICLKYKTDKAAEVGRLMAGLGRLANREVIDMPVVAPAVPTNASGDQPGDKMDVDGGSGTTTLKVEEKESKSAVSSGGGGKGKKKKGKK
jgi:Signal recognition particle 9 kDa protein (SRP9)